MSQDSFITALTNSLAPVCASVETLYKMIGDARGEQQVLKNEMRLVLDALRADVHGSREAVLVKVDASLGDLRAPLGQLAASEAQSARLIDGVRAQVVTLQQQVANVAQTQQTQQAQPPPPPQEPAPSFAGAFGKKMFPIEALTSKASLIFKPFLGGGGGKQCNFFILVYFWCYIMSMREVGLFIVVFRFFSGSFHFG